jgi:inorganic pyrophosphatase
VDLEAIVEIPRGSRNKYEMNYDTGEMWLDRELFTATRYPTDYGFVPNTLAEDGDPLDILVMVDLDGVPAFLLQEISNFFEIYKSLEPGKSTHTAGWQGRTEAEAAIEEARRRYRG